MQNPIKNNQIKKGWRLGSSGRAPAWQEIAWRRTLPSFFPVICLFFVVVVCFFPACLFLPYWGLN
jgi:hypothetical protein